MTRAQRNPVALSVEQALVSRDELVIENLDSAQQVVLGPQYGLGGIVLGEFLVVRPIEVAAIALRVNVSQLQQALLADSMAGDWIDHCNFGLVMPHADGRL